MKKYNLYNNITGWLVFIVAATTYLLTMEPTASYWDCPEFITTAYRMEIGHPPGAPFFMLIQRFFSLFASSPSHVAIMMNSWSAIASGLTILFLFWTISHLARKIVLKNGEEPTTAQLIAILGASTVGALAYTFSDTFWFSAVEAEVYATSSLFTALVFWAILKWENEADSPGSKRWLIFIAYMIGLSIGVHLLNLLAIPAIVFVYYFRKYKVTKPGLAIAFVTAIVLLAFIMYGVIPGVVKVASWFELLFVNSFGAPYNTGVVIYAALLITAVIWGLRYTIKKKKILANTILLAFTVIVIGYSSYAIVVIRSSANPPMDQNNPDNVFGLLAYLNREQYGDRPLLYGQYYDAPLDRQDPYTQGKPDYVEDHGKYIISNYKQHPNFDSRFETFFPRMYSSDPQHVSDYKSWVHITGTKIRTTDRNGNPKVLVKPSFADNLAFFFRYQVGWMYWRYFMWNFSGRQNDIQGHGDILRGNWITGIKFLDAARLGNQNNIPKVYANNKGRNTYFMLPLILGLLGIFFQLNSGKRGKRDFWVVFLLFFMTGIAIVLYLNQTPHQPRERDYAYAGSFYAFAIWIGLGVLALIDILKKVTPPVLGSILATVISLFAVPVLMASQNWDDHDRSNRYTARDFGADYLESCAPNAILFTNGDNDTFPLWYAQEVEGIRTDVRVCNLSYLQTDWYIDQMRQKAYKSDPLPINFTHDQYLEGTRDLIYVINQLKRPVNLKEAIDFVRSDDPRTKLRQADNSSYIPTNELFYPVDSAEVMKNHVITPEQARHMVKQLNIKLKGHYITKDELMILDMIANNNWKRPMYFAITVGSDKYLNLQNHFMSEGFAYRVVPMDFKSENGQIGGVDADTMYNNMMHKFKWGNMNDPNVYLDENNTRMAMNVRNNFVRLADALIAKGRKDSAITVLNKCEEIVPNSKVEYNYFNLLMAEDYFKAGANDKAKNVLNIMLSNYDDELNYFFSLQPKFQKTIQDDIQRPLFIIREMAKTADKYGEKDLAKTLSDKFTTYVQIYSSTN
ncbi:glycosyltransferase family 117 protein [Prolixibacter denitrificans]|uniref:Membrane protein n=1 Tax=Prolixibacter denitrificans TaxID=1541063 RepID=A0A2P8CL27_9BACT|nr:DUF2723 domain-containing protein [Prolixibacter denitrificans]PSK85682.1 uncharacterized protein DUF2723 [Prolixibacter denitrificans]GET20301.1 membrane protein [Prolixibacter denitrificans]